MVGLAVVAVAGCGGHRSATTSPKEVRADGGKPIVTHSADSDAPANAPAHWLPPEAWVYNHWLPYDEARLYRLLGITRVGLWQQLRDDRRTLAQLAARHGWPDPRRLAAALVAPDAARVGPRPGRASCGRARCARSRRGISPSTCSSTRCTSSASPARRRRSSVSTDMRVPRSCAAPS